MPARRRRDATHLSVRLAGPCNLACPVCDCRSSPSAVGADGWPPELGRGGELLEIRGEAALVPNLEEAVRRAREAGWSRIRVRTNAVGFGEPARASWLASLGVTEVVFFLASDRPRVHDAIARVPQAHRAGLRGARALAEAGVPMVLEIPVLRASIQDLRGTIALGRQAAHTAHALRLFSPAPLRPVDGATPRELAPPRWDARREALRDAVVWAAQAELAMAHSERDGIPLCAVASWDAEGRSTIPDAIFAPRPPSLGRSKEIRLGACCQRCPAAGICPGVTALYLSCHGDGGLHPLSNRPRRRERRAPSHPWDETRRNAARTLVFFVLRPTVHCNQDCWFCSSNETSRDVERDPGAMLRRIARLARTGVVRLSFSGGEPTLSPHLPSYVRAARDLGIEQVELVTNAVLLDRSERVAALIDAGLTRVFVSLHAHDEELSCLATRKIGDHGRTLRALELMAARPEVRLDVNHVVTAHNYRFLVRFVEWLHQRFGTRIGISFAYVSPQYRALEQVSRSLPRYAEVMPFLKQALARAWELDLRLIVGSRQGVPPCVLGDFLPFSDVLGQVSGALSEDAPQKTKSPQCAACRFDAVCAGIWTPYAELYGLNELAPVPGPRISLDQANYWGRLPFLRGTPTPQPLCLGTGRIPASSEIELPTDARPERALGVTPASEALRVIVVGTGPRGLAIASALRGLGDFELVAVASPHALSKDLPELGTAIVRASSVEQAAIERTADAVIVASHTADHAASARAAAARGLPCLVEKPLATTVDEAAALAAELGVRLTVIHQLRFAGGYRTLRQHWGDRSVGNHPVELALTIALTRASSSGMHAWSRSTLYQAMIHWGDLLLDAAGQPLHVHRATVRGEGRPDGFSVSASGDGPGPLQARVEARLDAQHEGLTLDVRLAGGRRLLWIRQGHHEEIRLLGPTGWRSHSPDTGNDLERLLGAWASKLRTGRGPAVSGAEGVAAMRFASDAIAAIESEGVAFAHANEPRRVASPGLRER